MPAVYETGHARNVAHFEDLISYCESFGAAYNPTRPDLSVASLNTLLAAANEALQRVAASRAALAAAVNTRQAAFAPLRPLATRIINALDASVASPALVRDARTLVRKISGRRAKALSVPEGAPPPTPETTVSVSQQSYDQLIAHFRNLIELLATEPAYAPNESDLRIPALQSLADALQAANAAVADAYAALQNNLIHRNNVLYTQPGALVPIAADVKRYVSSLFGASSPQFRNVSKIRFRLLA